MFYWRKLVAWWDRLVAAFFGYQLVILVYPTKEKAVAASKPISVKLTQAGSKPQAVMPPATITGPCGITLLVVDQNNKPVPGITTSSVTTSLKSNNPAMVLTPGADNLSWTAKIEPGTKGVAILSATLGFNSGSPGPFTASITLTLDIPPLPPVPTDLQIVVTPS